MVDKVDVYKELMKHRAEVNADFQDGNPDAMRVIKAFHLWNAGGRKDGQLLVDCLTHWKRNRTEATDED